MKDNDSKKKRFYEAYGKHILLIEFALILTLTCTFVIQIFFVPSIIIFTTIAWSIAVFFSILIHLLIFYKIAKMELYSYKILLLGRLRFYFSIQAYFSFFLSISLLTIISLFLNEIQRQNFSTIVPILLYVLAVVTPMAIIAGMLNITSITDHKRARLSFKTVLDAMEMLHKETKINEKMKAIGITAKWFKEGLLSFNRHLYKDNPTHLEIADIEQYHRSVCIITLMGKRKEIDDSIEQIKFALSCMDKKREDGLKCFLIALKNIKSGKRKKEYQLSELNEMIRISPFSEKIKGKLTSPYITVITLCISVIALILRVLPFLSE